MTTIAYRDGVLASDSLGNRNGLRRKVKKVYRVGDHIMGGCGNYQDCIAFVNWWPQRNERELSFRQYSGDKDAPDLYMIVVGPGGAQAWGEHLQPTDILDDFYAVGSGASAAMAAMHMGASAEEAVRIASLVDIGTGGDIETVTLD